MNARHRLNPFQILYRLYYWRVGLHTIFPQVSPNYVKCDWAEDDLLQSYAQSPKLHGFGCTIFSFILRILKHIRLWIRCCYIEQRAQTKILQTVQHPPLSYALLCAKKPIFLLWKIRDVATFKSWITPLADTLHLERIRYTLNDILGDYERIWSPFLDGAVG